MTDETKRKISESRKKGFANGTIVAPKGMLGKRHSLLTMARMSGKRTPFTEEHKRKISVGRKKFFIVHPEERVRLSKKYKGSNSNFWKGGLTNASRIERQSYKYKLWRTAVFERDNYTCQICGIRPGNGKKVILNADHIKLWSVFIQERFELNNGRTLCLPCHKKTPTWGGVTKFKKKVYG